LHVAAAICLQLIHRAVGEPPQFLAGEIASPMSSSSDKTIGDGYGILTVPMVGTNESLTASTARHLMNLKQTLQGSLLVVTIAAVLATPPRAQSGTESQEANDGQQAGDSIYQGYKSKRQIVESSPLYALLEPIGRDIVRVAQPRYEHPIRLLLIHDPQPNAFAAPGGNVYVTDELLYLSKNQEELAGTLCHEVSHLIHHDSEAMAQKQMQVVRRELGASILLGAHGAELVGIALAGKLNSLHYSRDVESRADLTGADVCAAAGHNPWGLVWLFSAFGQANMGEGPEFLSDHPDNESRIEALKDHFKANPAVFSRFSPEKSAALALVAPAKAPLVFLR
jgi:predicted Zn-dependent protease